MVAAFDPVVFKEHPAVMLLVDPGTGAIVACNRAAVAFYGWSVDELTSRTITSLNALPPAQVAAAMASAKAGRSVAFHFPHRLADGSQRWVEVRSGLVEVDGRALLHSIIIDETARVEAERALAQRSLQANLLSAARGWLMRANEEQDVFHAVCAVAVRTGGFAEAVITKPTGDGGRRVVHRELRAEDEPVPGSEGYTSASVAFPLRCQGAGVADLTLRFAGPSEIWDPLVRVLGELVDDASYTLDVIAERRARAAAVRQVEVKARTAQVLLELPALAAELSEADFLQHGLGRLEQLTGSTISFVHRINEDAKSIELITWSRDTLAHYCQAVHDRHYPIREAGIWADAYRQRAPVICNDYAAHVGKHGLPQGHAALTRFMSIPVLEGGSVRMLTGVGNKPTEYTAEEVEAVRLVSEEMWRLSQRERLAQTREAERRFQATLIEHLGEAVVACDAEGRITIVNDTAQAWYGSALAPGMAVEAWSGTFGRQQTTQAASPHGPLLRALAGEYIRDEAMRLTAANGKTLQVRVRGGPLLDAAGRSLGAIIVLHDHSAEETGAAALRLRSAALEAAADAVIITAPNGSIEWANPAFSAISGYPLDEVIGRNPRDLVKSGLNEPSVYARLWRTILAGEVWSGELVNRRKDGSTYPEWLTITPVKDATGKLLHFVAIKRDLTEDTVLRNSLLQAQKMEVVGRLAGGIAHDFNNLLTVIHGAAELAAEQMPPDSPGMSDLRDVQQAATRASALTRQLLAFSRRQVMRREVLDVNRIVSELSRMLSRLIGEDVAVRMELRADAWKVLGDAGQLEQVVLNLVVNARDAMPTGGSITIITENVTIDERAAARVGDLRPGDHLVLTVRDTGTGMSDEVRDHIFEPFYTTKGLGQGTGLGLSTVYGIVRQSDGAIAVETAPGRGTSFRLFFPRADGREHGSGPRLAKPILQQGAGTILVVDDEPVLRKVAARILERAGYTAFEAGDAAEAEAIMRARGGAVDLLVTDVVMPDVNGPELAERLTAAYPALKVLYTSGYTSESMAVEAVYRAEQHFLPKPYTIESLTKEVAAVLAGTPTAAMAAQGRSTS